MVLVAIMALFVSTEAVAYNQPDGLCPPEEAAVFECVNINGWIIEIYPDLVTGEFPVRTAPDDPVCASCSVFEYLISGSGSGKAVSILSELVPVCDSDFNGDGIIDNAIELAGPSLTNNSLKLFPAGAGDSWGWGEDNFDVRVLQWSLQVSPSDTERFIAYTTVASSEKSTIRAKIGQAHVAGQILAASCYEPNVAETTFENIQLDPLDANKCFKVTKGADKKLRQVTTCQDIPVPARPISDITCTIDGAELPLTYLPSGIVTKFGTDSWYCYGPYAGQWYCYQY